MTNVVSIARPAAEPDRIAALEAQVAALTAQVGGLLAEIEARLPPPKFELPKGWLAIKQAAGICGVPEPTLYRWTRRGKIMSVKRGFRVFIDPNDKEINRLVTRERAS